MLVSAQDQISLGGATVTTTAYNHEGLSATVGDDGEVSLHHEGKRVLTMTQQEFFDMAMAIMDKINA